MTDLMNTPPVTAVRQAIEALAQACGLEAASMPADAPGLMIDTEDGLRARIGPHPWDKTALTVEIGYAELGATRGSDIDHASSARALQALFELGDALADRSTWRLGLDEALQWVLSSVLALSPGFDVTDAARMIEEGFERARAVRALSTSLRGGPTSA